MLDQIDIPDVVDVLHYPSPEGSGAEVVYAVGDVHGRLDLLLELEALIAHDIARSAWRAPVVCYLGDYIDRGPQSAAVIDLLSRASSPSVNRVFLRGNHEDRMLQFLREPESAGESWLRFGGLEALQSYGVPGEISGGDFQVLHAALVERLPQAHRDFLEALRLAFVWGGYVFVHAGLDPAAPAERQRPRDLMWIREPFLSSDRDWGRRIVHGHVITAEPEFRPNRIGIDTGAYAGGPLTCLVVSGENLRLLQTDVST